MTDLYNSIYCLVRQVPYGTVATYGQIARIIGNKNYSRQVGYALAACRDDSLPWHRIVNFRGEISHRTSDSVQVQRIMLEQEGIVFDNNNRVNLERYRCSIGT